jgi:hypothetical protein
MNLHTALCLWLCVAMAGCQPNGLSQTDGVSDAKALIGQEYLLVAAEGRLVEGSPCEFKGGGVVWENEEEKIGWADSVAVCRGIPVLVLSRTGGRASGSTYATLHSLPRWKIVAVQALPKVVNYAEEDLGSDPLELVGPASGQCSIGSADHVPSYVLLRWLGRKAVAGPPAVEAVWAVDAKGGRFVALEPRKVECDQLSMD